jgi:protein ImuA
MRLGATRNLRTKEEQPIFDGMSARFPDLPAALGGTLDVAVSRHPPVCPFGTSGPIPGQNPIAAPIRLAPGRVHEATGSARTTFAVAVAGALPGTGPGVGPVIWIRPAWAPDRLHPDGMRPFADPGRFLFVDASRDADLLWCMEEALRSGQAPLVVADLPAVPGLTSVRRLTLAAEAGTEAGSSGRRPPTGLILTPGAGGAPGVETRWRMDTAHGPDAGGPAGSPADGSGPDAGRQIAWRVERLRARMAPPAAFRVAPDRDGRLTTEPAHRLSTT